MVVSLVGAALCAAAPLTVLYYSIFEVFSAQSGGGAYQGSSLGDALRLTIPAAAVEMVAICLVFVVTRAVSAEYAGCFSHRAVAVLAAAFCSSIPTALFVGLAAWPVVFLTCFVPACLAVPVFMRPRPADL